MVFEGMAFYFEVGLFGVFLRFYGNVFTRGHRHGAGNQSGSAGENDAIFVGLRGGNSDNQAGGRYDPVVGAEHGGAQPPGAMNLMVFFVC